MAYIPLTPSTAGANRQPRNVSEPSNNNNDADGTQFDTDIHDTGINYVFRIL